MKYLILVGILFINGCASNQSLYFGTYNRVGIDASANGVGIGTKVAAVNITPPKSDGSAFDVLGTSDLDIDYIDVVIKEVVAVGKAAKCASMSTPTFPTINAFLLKENNNAGRGASTKKNNNADIGRIIFGAYSSWSLLDLSWGGATATGINFGYKRGVGIKVPIVNDKIGSAFALITVNTASTSESETVALKSNIGGTRSKHTFATGNAAIIKASKEAGPLNDDNQFSGCLF